MQTAIKLTTIVSPDGKIEIAAPELLPGKTVEVIILFSEQSPLAESSGHLAALDILQRASGQRQFKSAAEVEQYVRQERAAWDD